VPKQTCYIYLAGDGADKNEQRTAKNKGLKSEESADDYLRVAYRKLLLSNNPKSSGLINLL